MINLLEQDPVNIAGVAVRTPLENQQRVAAELGQWPGVEVHLQGEQGQLVVTDSGHWEGHKTRAVVLLC